MSTTQRTPPSPVESGDGSQIATPAGAALLVEPSVPWTGRARRRALAIVLLLLIAAVLALIVTDPFHGHARAGSGMPDNASPTGLMTVARRSLDSQQSENGTLTFAGNYSVINQAHGTITALPSIGQIVHTGRVLYEVSGEPVVLLYGHTPAYRPLRKGVQGADVRELNSDLVALGYTTPEAVGFGPYASSTAADYFGVATKDALELLQEKLRVKKTGVLALGQAVFLPGPLRITKVTATLGAQAPPGSPLAQASSTKRQVVVDLNAAQQSSVKRGDRVTITLPNEQTTPGVVSSVGTVAVKPSGQGGNEEGVPTVEVVIRPLDSRATGHLDQAPVQVLITTARVNKALAVPVAALLALAGGGYAVEVAEGRLHHLLAVSIGLFDDAEGLVQVSGAGLSAGQRVVVPAS